MQFFINGTVDRFEGDKAVIILNDSQILLWPKADLPAESTEGGAVKIMIEAEPAKTAENEQTAKDYINDILRND